MGIGTRCPEGVCGRFLRIDNGLHNDRGRELEVMKREWGSPWGSGV